MSVTKEIDHQSILDSIRKYYEENLNVNGTLEEDLKSYPVDLDNILASYIRIAFGEKFVGNCLPPLIVDRRAIYFDGELYLNNPTAVQIYASLLSYSMEFGEILDDCFIKEDKNV